MEDPIKLDDVVSALGNAAVRSEPLQLSPEAALLLVNALAAPPKRYPLPGRRKGYTRKLKIDDWTFYMSVGEYPDGRLGELFLSTAKDGAAFRSMMSCFGIAISIALQYGVPLEEFVTAFKNVKFQPSGHVWGHEKITKSSSLIDLVFRELALEYLDREDMAGESAPPEPEVPLEGGT